jgi:hypothetical protein
MLPAMPITPFLSGQVFEPKALLNMSAAFEAVCDRLGAHNSP